ncbi:MAG: hypothetical protein NXI20_02080 [bacterium]|nr:hypothetical protein [bacterium]
MKNNNSWLHFQLQYFRYVGNFLVYSVMILLTVAVFYYKFTPSEGPEEDVKSIQYKGRTTGIITSAEPHTGMKQNQYGTRITTNYFIVTYQYQVGDSVYNGSDQLRNTQVLAREVERLRGNGFRDSVVVRYDKKEVQRSVVEL